MNQYYQQQQPSASSLYSRFQGQLQHGNQSHQGSFAWNGAQWIPTVSSQGNSISTGNSGVHYSNFTYQHQQQQLLQQQQTQYSQECYRHYYNQSIQFRNEAAKAGISDSERKEAERKAAWSEYYARQAYNGQIPQEQTPSAQAPPPPPPVKFRADPQAQGKDEDGDEYPSSLKRYVKKSLENCSTTEEREQAQKWIERAISTALKNNSMWTTDWDKEIVPLSPSGSLVSREQLSARAGTSSGPDIVSREHGTVSEFPDAVSQKRETARQISSSSSSSSLSSSSSIVSLPFPSRETPLSPPSRKPSLQSSSKKRKMEMSSHSKGFEKRKINDYDSSLPLNDSYYGLSTTDRAFEKKQPMKKTDHGKKKECFKKSKNTGDSSGFESSSLTLEARANRFCVKGEKMTKSKQGINKIDAQRKYMGQDIIGGGKNLDENDFEQMTVKGVCQTLEKKYLRLTSPPKASAVRPQTILEKHLLQLKQMYSRGERDYAWFCSQFKAIRQDLTVQRINNAFTVEVYETHARIGLEKGDLNEYNQCQTQLKELYNKIDQQDDEMMKTKGLRNLHEFLAYRIIYYVFLSCNKKYEGGSSDMLNIMLSLTPLQKKDPCIDHALKGMCLSFGAPLLVFTCPITYPITSLIYLIFSFGKLSSNRGCRE
mmetsp:Transcript_44062/g.64748  ORF Transcript_44062/g.64748 Transcript_44062/m.64748 type:complete len:653 (+) Transcript_44062:62-2020(+)